MRLFNEQEMPIQFLLHVINGVVSELEIFRVDSSLLDPNIAVKNYKMELIINEE
jgi:hypothetical protein